MKLNRMEVLSQEEISRIIDASANILAEKGVKIDSGKALNALKTAGAPVDLSEGIVKFPRELQEACIKSAPKKIPAADRNGNYLYTIGDGNSYFASGHNAVFIDEPMTGVHRNFTLKDVENFARLSHHLEDIDMIGLPASPSDVHHRTALLYSLAATFKNSTKPVFFSTDSEVINHYAMELTSAAGANKNGAYMISQLSPTSPLFWEKGAVEGIIECAEKKFPVAILPEPIAGMSAPYSIAGLITVHNVEALSGVFITQLINPGAPVIWASSWTTFDMKRSCALVGSLETTLARIGGAQVAKQYGLPLHTTAPNSDNHAHDEQNAWEKVLSTFCAVAAGNELIVNCGMYACGMTISLEQLVMDAEIAGQVRKLCAGLDAGPDAVAEELIMATGHRGSYIMADHTLNRLDSGEFREPLLCERGSRDIWVGKGSRDAAAMAHETAGKLLKKDAPLIEASRSRDMEKIILECEKNL